MQSRRAPVLSCLTVRQCSISAGAVAAVAVNARRAQNVLHMKKQMQGPAAARRAGIKVSPLLALLSCVKSGLSLLTLIRTATLAALRLSEQNCDSACTSHSSFMYSSLPLPQPACVLEGRDSLLQMSYHDSICLLMPLSLHTGSRQEEGSSRAS